MLEYIIEYASMCGFLFGFQGFGVYRPRAQGGPESQNLMPTAPMATEFASGTWTFRVVPVYAACCRRVMKDGSDRNRWSDGFDLCKASNCIG